MAEDAALAGAHPVTAASPPPLFDGARILVGLISVKRVAQYREHECSFTIESAALMNHVVILLPVEAGQFRWLVKIIRPIHPSLPSRFL
jgi:hypothetical protein